MIGAAFTVRTPPHHSARTGPVEEDDEDDEGDKDDNYALGFHVHHHHQDEIGMSQLDGAPLGTQGDE
jgi:hypothetical protein